MSPLEQPLAALPEPAEFTFSQHFTEGADLNAVQPNFLINALPPSLEFGTNTLLFADACGSGSGASEPLSGQIDYYRQTQFPLAAQGYPTPPVAVPSVPFDYALQNYEFDLDGYMSNQLLTFN